MGYQKILVTLDGSKLAEQALQHIFNIAAPTANIHLLSVMAPDTDTEAYRLASASLERAQSNAQWPNLDGPDAPNDPAARLSYLKDVSAWLAQADQDVTFEVLSGETISTIVEVLNRGFQILVIATHRRSGASKMVVGSVAEAILAQSPCPVLIVTPPQ